MTSPVALFVYNRPLHTKQTVDALVNNHLAGQTDLFIFSDGPRADRNAEEVKEVRRLIYSIEGFKSVKIIESNTNKGLANSIIGGVTSVLGNHETVIVLEDDLVTSPYFLSYMNQGLKLYADDDKVISIHGYTYPVKDALPQSFFLRGADCWGWGTWKRGWRLFEHDGKTLLNELVRQDLGKAFNFNNAYPYVKMLNHQIKGLNDSWAIRWYASAFLKNKLTLYPGASLVKNIGFDDSGTHSHASSKRVYDTTVNTNEFSLRKIAAEENQQARKTIAAYLKSTRPSILRRILNKTFSAINGK